MTALIALALILQQSGTTASLRGVSAVNDRVAWASGSDSTWLRTTDGGAHWMAGRISDNKLDFRGIHAFSAKEAIAMSSGEGALSQVFETHDGGAHWHLLFINPDPSGFFDSIAFRDRKHGVLMGDPVNGRFTVFVTSDGGKTWVRRTGPKANAGESAFAASNSVLRVRGKREIWLASGGVGGARVFRSEDDGITWSEAQTPIRHDSESAGIFSLELLPGRGVVVVGGDYRKDAEPAANLAVSGDDGKTWELRPGVGGFRSAVQVRGGRWIVTGTSGTDVSGDGMAWRQVDSGSWNAVSGSFAVGPKGRIGRFSH